jgi:hypothetical protein
MQITQYSGLTPISFDPNFVSVLSKKGRIPRPFFHLKKSYLILSVISWNVDSCGFCRDVTRGIAALNCDRV